MPKELRARHVVFEATLLPNYLAASHFPTGLLTSHGLYPVGTRETTGTLKTKTRAAEDAPTKTLLLAGEPERVLAFAQSAMRKPRDEKDPIWGQLREFADLKLPAVEEIVKDPRQRLGDGEIITWEVVLNPIGRDETERLALAPEAFRRWVAYVRTLDGEVDVNFRREVSGVVFVPIALHTEAIRSAARFNLVRAIRPMPTIRPYRPTLRRSAARAQLPVAPGPGTRPLTQERVAIFDGGINQLNGYMRPFVTIQDLTTEPATEDNLEHGSMVTSAFLFGHIAPGQKTLPIPIAHVDHFRVLPPPPSATFDHSTYQLLDAITEKVRERKYRFVNLSLGPDEIVDDGEPHYWTAALDELAADLGVTFFVAAGNNGEEDDALGFNRVQVPGDMVNGLTIGAAATVTGTKAVRASYSAIGPGRSGQRVQPIGVSFGGDASLPFGGIDHRGRYAETAGTSFASPLAMRGAVQLGEFLGRDRTIPSAIRSFSAHFAERARRGHNPIQLGFGRLPSSYERIFACEPHEVSVVYQDTLARGEIIAMRLPVPTQGLNDNVELELEWTIAFTSRVNPSDSTDYTLSGIEDTLRPHDLIRSASRNGESLELDLRTSDLHALESAGWNVSQVPKAYSQRLKAGNENSRRSAGKWETILRGRVRLSAGELYLPRLDLKHISREDGVLTREVAPLHMSMVATVRAAAGSVALYDLVRQQFRILTPIVTHLPIRISAGA